MVRIVVYFSLLAAFGCTFWPKTIVDVDLYQYDEMFLEEASMYCKPEQLASYVKKTVQFNKLEKYVIGTCTRNNLEMIIDIDIMYWAVASEVQRKSLYFHEALHCYLHLPDDEFDKDDIMYKEMENLSEAKVYDSLHKHLEEHCK